MKTRLETLKNNWQISKNWQLLYPVVGTTGCLYTGFKIANNIIDTPLWISIVFGLGLGLTIMKLCLFFISKLESKWIVKERWQLIRIFIVFAITGSSSMFVGRPIIKWLGITTDNFNLFVYWFSFIFTSLIFYQILLVFWGFIFGQFDFFWNFEKKMLRRFGLGRFLNNE